MEENEMIIGVHHVQITIPKGAEAEGRHFYCNILGLKEIDKPDSLKGRGGFWLQLANIDIHVGNEDTIDRTSTKAHLAYQVEDIMHWRKVLTDNQITIIESIPIPYIERFEFRDPFGNRVEILQVV